ncbi:putative transmembrane protein, partial [Toxoplasma gondii p89]
FLWLIALRLLGGAIVYVAIALFLASFFVAGGVGMWFVHAQAVPAETVRPGEDQGGTVMNSFWIEVTRYSSYAVLGIGGVFAVLMVFLSQRIREGVAVTKVRSANRYE